ncbi:histone deacetylase complex subunit SAP130-like [Scleropages formosus]|uniref:Histone deacetylase complex subunit SAP130-like n=1 Tax=Scleropages formosus TaxID=113540 RepID=A0A0P7XV42_SCLFO|nr:histone deacetylase complex subunit SAP130-like [Scleropages formosus]
MSSQQFPRTGVPPPGLGQPQVPGPSGTMGAGSQSTPGGSEESCRDPDHNSRDHPPGSGGGSGSGGGLPFRDEKQETVVVRPYPQVQAHSQPLTMAQHLPIQAGTPVTVSATPTHLPQGLPLAFAEGPMKSTLKTSMPSRLIAPAPASNQGHLTKVPGHVTVTMENSMPQSSAIPVATISGQQGHSSNLHHLMAANVQIIRSSTPALQIGSSAPPPHTFTSHLPRGAAAAAVMSSTKGPTVLRPASGPSAGAGQPTVQHIIHQPIQSRPVVTTSTAVLPTVVAPVSATRAQSPVITTTATHPAEILHGRPGLTIHPPPPATISIQRPPSSRDTATRITLPSHPAIGTPKPQAPHTMTQKSIFSTVTPVAAATVAPILATNTVPSPTTTGRASSSFLISSVSHTQMTTSNIVTMTMASHSSHATAVTTSTIPVAKVVPQPIAHTSPRIQPEYPGERGNLIPISGHRSSPNPVTMEARSDNRQPVPVQFQYFLPTYPSSPYPLTHTYTPITSTVSTIRQYPVTPQAPSSAMPSQAGVGVASAVHLNSMQLMTVDRITQISTQGIQPAAMAAQSIQSGPVGTQGLHTSAPIGAQSIQPAPLSAQQPQAEAKASGKLMEHIRLLLLKYLWNLHEMRLVLADGSTLVANPIGSTFGAAPPVTTATGTHPQGSSSSAPTLVSSPRPSILRKKPASERVKTKSDIHVAIAPPVPAPMEALPSQISEQSQQQQATPSPAQHPSQAIKMIKQEVEPMDTSQPGNTGALTPVCCLFTSSLLTLSLQDVVILLSTVSSMTPGASAMLAPLGNALGVPGADVIPGASPRKKPRKQQHVISTEESEMVETNSTDEEKAVPRPPSIRPEKRKSPPKEYIDEEGVRYVPVRIRPPVTLLRHYRNPWKAAYHHFQRYSDIRVKEEKKGTLQDVANQKGVVCRAQGWKVHLCAAQLLQLTSLERDVYSRLTTLQEGLIPKKKAGADDELHRINELIQGNMQRCKLVMDQITEARDAMMKVLDHKDRVLKLLNKNGGAKKVSKLKRKEKA